MRGKETSPLIVKAVRLLDGHLEPLEIGKVLGLAKRTAYDLLKRVRAEIAQEEADRKRAKAEEVARQEREQLDRQRWEARVMSRLRIENDRFSPTGGEMGVGRFLD